MNRRSRLALKSEKKTRKTLLLSVIGIAIILVFLTRFGTDILINFSVFLGEIKGQQSQTSKKSSMNYLSPPTLNPLPVATNGAQLIISGTAASDETIVLYINDKLIEETESKSNGTFSFKPDLSKGENLIKVLAKKDDKESDYSEAFNVVYKDTPPSLEINSPSDGQNFKKDQNTAKVSGKTEGGVNVTINSFWAVIDENNNFSYDLPLQNGENQIKIVATDQAGNKAEKSLKVTYSQ